MTGWYDDESEEGKQAWRAFVEQTREHTAKQLRSSAIVINLYPDEDEIDVKYATQLGLTLLFDKPLVVIVQPGATIPSRLRRAADLVVEADIDTEAGKRQLADALAAFNEHTNFFDENTNKEEQ